MVGIKNYREKKTLLENERKVNIIVSRILFSIGITVIPLIFILKITGVFLYDLQEAIVPMVITLIFFALPRILINTQAYKSRYFKYYLVFSILLCLPGIYIQFDYMALITWIFPLIISSYYYHSKLDRVTIIASIIVLGMTSYYRSYLRFHNGLIDEVVGSLFKDFIISYITYAMLLFITYIMMNMLTRRTNELLKEMVKAKQYELMSITDSLTGIFNHRYLMDTLNNKRIELEKMGTPFSIILFDIDHFKAINDTYGHLVGDETLVKISNCLSETIRETDILGRYGGEEFMVILPNTKKTDATAVAERCRKAVSMMEAGNINVKITISGGVQECRNHKIVDLIYRVDRKLYKAKNNGRNRVVSVL